MAYAVQNSRQQSGRLETTVPVTLDYLLALPKDYDTQEKWPLVLFLHGAGERGPELEKVKVHGPPKLVEEGKEFPFILLSPQCPNEQWWQPTELVALLDDISEKYKVDQDRIYVTGISMGGFGTWSLVHYAPSRFAAIAPICGGGVPYWAKSFSHVPAWVFHGAKDNVIPVQFSQDMVTALEKANGDVRLTIYPEANHDSWTETYNNDKLYEWLLSHKRRVVNPPKETPPAPVVNEKVPAPIPAPTAAPETAQ